MTSKDLYEIVLIEINKVQAPTLLIEDFNYLVNKSINQYINKRTAQFDVTQQLADDLRVITKTVHLTPGKIERLEESNQQHAGINTLYGLTYQVSLPLDYRHLLSCICTFKNNSESIAAQCGNAVNYQNYVVYPARRLESDKLSAIINNYYMRPNYNRPYFYIHEGSGLMGKQYINDEAFKSDTDAALASQNYHREFTIGADHYQQLVGNTQSEIGYYDTQSEQYVRVGNPTEVAMQIKCGDNPDYELVDVTVDYLRAPQHIQLTQTQLDLTIDTSQVLEWPDYVCYEIVNELVHLIMENSLDQRLPAHASVTTSIA